MLFGNDGENQEQSNDGSVTTHVDDDNKSDEDEKEDGRDELDDKVNESLRGSDGEHQEKLMTYRQTRK